MCEAPLSPYFVRPCFCMIMKGIRIVEAKHRKPRSAVRPWQMPEQVRSCVSIFYSLPTTARKSGLKLSNGLSKEEKYIQAGFSRAERSGEVTFCTFLSRHLFSSGRSCQVTNATPSCALAFWVSFRLCFLETNCSFCSSIANQFFFISFLAL